MRPWRIVLLGLLASGCLDPLTSDTVPMRDVFPAGTDVPWISGEAAHEVDEYDGFEGDVIPRLSGFAKGRRVWYWDFGPAPSFTAPLWAVVDAEGAPVQAPVWDVVPGDPGYSPFWAIRTVRVTDLWAGEVIASRQGIDDAIRDGLLEPPERSNVYVNCPVVAQGTTISVGGVDEAGEPNAPHEPRWAYCRGVKVAYFDFDENEDHHRPVEGLDVPVGSVYELTRVDESLPLSEPARRVDMTGDGDTNDTNNVFDLDLEDRDLYTPLWRYVDVSVRAATGSIDTTGDEASAEIMTEARLFDRGEDGSRTPAVDADENPWVVGYEVSELLVNCPLQTAAGQI